MSSVPPVSSPPSTTGHGPDPHGSTRRRSLERTEAWRYIGYRGYSDFISSDDDFFILRRFATLNVRVALALQNEIVQLEKDLDELDDKYEAPQSPPQSPVHNGRFDGDVEDREKLLKEIGEKLYKYSR